MATVNSQAPVPAGFAPAMSAASAGGDSYFNTGRETVLFRNSTAGAITVTVDAPNPDNFGFSGNPLDVTVTVPANSERYIAGPFSTARHNDAQGKVQMTYSTNVGLSFAVLAH